MNEHHYSHDAMLDDARLGNEPSEEYLERVRALDNLVRECMYVSKGYGNIPSPTSRHFYASVLFTVLTTRAVSLANLIPHTPWAEKLIEHWDYASAAGIVRTMLEVRLALYYLCVDPCPRAEWECRWNVFNLHDCRARQRLSQERSTQPSEIEGFEQQADELRERLRANAYFQALPEKQQKRFLSGHVAYLIAMEDIAEHVNFEKSEFRWLYAFLSSHVHALPMSFYRIGGLAGDGRGRGLPTPVEEGYTSLCVSVATVLLAGARDEIQTLFAGMKNEQSDAPSVEEQLVQAEGQLDTFPVGGTRTLVEADLIRIDAERPSADTLLITYYNAPTNEAVLRRRVSDEYGNSLEWFDSCFWTVSIDGGPATVTMLDAMGEKPMAFKVDANTRTISFKVK